LLRLKSPTCTLASLFAHYSKIQSLDEKHKVLLVMESGSLLFTNPTSASTKPHYTQVVSEAVTAMPIQSTNNYYSMQLLDCYYWGCKNNFTSGSCVAVHDQYIKEA